MAGSVPATARHAARLLRDRPFGGVRTGRVGQSTRHSTLSSVGRALEGSGTTTVILALALNHASGVDPLPVTLVGSVLTVAALWLACWRLLRPTSRLPQLLRGTMVLMDDLVDVVDVERAGAVRIDRVGDVREQAAELRLVVAGHELAGGAAPQTWTPQAKDCSDLAVVGTTATGSAMAGGDLRTGRTWLWISRPAERRKSRRGLGESVADG